MRARKAGGVVAAGCATMLGLSLIHPFGHPQAVHAEPRAALLERAMMPEETKRVLVTRCADCHSDTTHWPAYARVAPVSWLIERDVTRGRERLNLSHWQDLPEDQREVLSTEITQQAKKGAMPPPLFRLVHRGADLTAADVAAVSLLAPGEQDGAVVVSEGDAARGKAVFERKCTGCHSLDESREGPRLRGVYGRAAGTVPGFKYSAEMRDSGITWTEANIERWIRDSDAMIPGTAMGFSVPKAQDRADIVAFLKTQK